MSRIAEAPETPAFIYDWDRIEAALLRLSGFRRRCERQLLYSIKAVPLLRLLERIQPWVDGFAVSSPFEARLAREVLGPEPKVHLTTPGIAAAMLPDLAASCSHVSFNSLSQWLRLAAPLQGRVSTGIRINPGIPTGLDRRHDPSRPHSKLGVSLADLLDAWQTQPALFESLAGLHVHNNFNAVSLTGLRQTLECIEASFGARLEQLQWLNLGGGLLLEDGSLCAELCLLAERLTRRYGLQVAIEPGNGVVGAAGQLVSEVIDLFVSGGQPIAVLDTTVSHLPRVFEYQFTPPVTTATATGPYRYTLAGSSCLAGDLFGDYAFEQPLQLGSRIVFANVGAYMLVKANRFNGINLPAVYSYRQAHGFELIKDYQYADYRQSWGNH